MRNFASGLVLACVLAAAPLVAAEAPTPKSLYTGALAQERTLRLDLDARTSSSNTQAPLLLKRIRSLVASYERLSRQYPGSPYMDNALWQGALLSSDAFWSFGESADRDSALKMFSWLAERFPTSSLVHQSASYVKRLKAATPTPAAPRNAASSAPAPVSVPKAAAAPPLPTPVSTLAAPIAADAPTPATLLTSIRRDVLPDAVRVTLELGREVPFHVDHLGGPPRVYIDFDNTRAVDALKDATVPFPDDVVKQIRIGRQADSRTRVVMDLNGEVRHSTYAMYNPYRVVIDFERPAIAEAVAKSDTPETPSPAASIASAAGAALDAPTPAVATVSATATAPRPSSAAASVEAGAPVANEAAPLPTPEAPPAPPAPEPPATNASGRFSLSRQLGLSVSRIVIDPGHGGHDPGAKTKGLTEADLVLDVALRLEKLLQKHEGFDVVLTRRADTFVPLEERTAIANREGADLFLSIHANASKNTSARGVETYFLNLAPNPDAEVVAARENAASSRSMRQLPDIVKAIALNNKIRESRDFASMIQTSLAGQIQKTDRSVRNLGVKQAPFMVLLGATMPSVLAEISFITNRQDASLLKTEKHRQRIAEALYAGVLRYQQSLKAAAPAIAEQ